MADVDYGKVWGAIRFGLTKRRERLLAAFDAKNYEQESAQLDALARELTDDVAQVVEKGD
ncbi:MAG: hypothetical protein AAFR11_05720 [Pseudomonadota bacterium]